MGTAEPHGIILVPITAASHCTGCAAGSHGSLGPTPTPTPPPHTPPLGHAHSLGAPGSNSHHQHNQIAANAAIAAALQVRRRGSDPD